MLTRGLVKYPVFAAIVAIFLAIFPWLDWLSSIIIAIMVLSEAITASIITLLLVSALETWHYDFQWNLAAFADQLSFYLIWLSAMVLRKSSQWNKLLNGFAGLGLLTVIILHMTVPHLHSYWVQKLNEGLGELNQQVSSVLVFTSAIPGGAALMKTWEVITGFWLTPTMISLLAVMASSFWISGVVFASLFNLGLARFWQHKVMGVGNLHDELMAFRLHRIFGVIMVLLLLAYGLRPNWLWAADALAWMALVTITAGVLYAYWQIGRWPLPWLWGIIALVACVFYPLSGFILLSALGILDSIIDLRRLQL